MKKFLVPVGLIFVIGLGLIVFSIYRGYQNTQYEKDMMAHVMAVNRGGELIAEYNGAKTRVLGSNIGRIRSILTVTARQRVYTKPRCDTENAVKLTFSDGAEYIVAQDPAGGDSAFVLYSYKGKKLYFKIEGYKTLDWTIRAVSPEGIAEENEVIAENS
jgi:hypothetical protein